MIAWWQALLVIVGQGLVVVTAVQMGANIADKSRMRAVLDEHAKWKLPPDGH